MEGVKCEVARNVVWCKDVGSREGSAALKSGEKKLNRKKIDTCNLKVNRDAWSEGRVGG